MEISGKDLEGDDLTFFLEYVHLQFQVEVLEALGIWGSRFTQFREEGRYDLCQRLLRSIKRYNLPAYGLGIVRYSEGWLYDRIGRWQEAIAAYKASLDAFQAANMPGLDVELWTNIGSLYQDQGYWAEAEKAYQSALDGAQQQNNQLGYGRVLNNLGNLYQTQNKTEKAMQCYQEAVTVLQKKNDIYNAAAAQLGLGLVYQDQGKSQDALDNMIGALSKFHTLFLIKRRPFLFEIDITHSNRGRFYSKSEIISYRNGLNSTFPNK